MDRVIYGEEPKTLFEMKIAAEDALLVLNKSTGIFEAKFNAQILAHAAHGIFTITKNENGRKIVRFDVTKLFRSSIVIACFSEGAFRLRCRIVVTETGGLLCFPLHKTFENVNGVYTMPDEFIGNTVLVLGIASISNESTILLRVYANETGYLNELLFNGYQGEIKYDRTKDQVVIGNTLTANWHQMFFSPIHYTM